MKCDVVDFVVVGSGIFGIVCAHYLLERGYSVGIVRGVTRGLNVCESDNNAQDPIDLTMNELPDGNLMRWGSRLSFLGCSKEFIERHYNSKSLNYLLRIFGVDNLEVDEICYPDNEILRVAHQKVISSCKFYNLDLSRISVAQKTDGTFGFTDQLDLSFRKKLLVTCGAVGNAALYLRSFNDVSKLSYSGHISGIIGLAKVGDVSKYDFQRGVRCYKQKPLCHIESNDININFLCTIVNFPINNPQHGSASLSFIYVVLSSVFGRRLMSKPLLRKLTTGDIKYRSHFRNFFNLGLYDLRFLFSVGYQKFILRKKNPFALLKNKEGLYPVHVHFPMDSDSGSISIDGINDINIKLHNKCDNFENLFEILDEKIKDLVSPDLDIKLDYYKFLELLSSSRDGYHQFISFDFPFSRDPCVPFFFSTALLVDNNCHYPTFPGLVEAVSLLEDYLDG